MKGGAKIYVGPPFLRQRWGHGPVAPPGSALAYHYHYASTNTGSCQVKEINKTYIYNVMYLYRPMLK